MITEKYFNTERSIILVGKETKVEGTSFLARLEKLEKEDSTLVVRLDFVLGDTLLSYLSGMIGGIFMVAPTSTEVLVLLDEVTWLSKDARRMLVGTIEACKVGRAITFVCTGESSALLEMFDSEVEAKFFKMSPHNGDDFVLTGTQGDVVTIKGDVQSDNRKIL